MTNGILVAVIVLAFIGLMVGLVIAENWVYRHKPSETATKTKMIFYGGCGCDSITAYASGAIEWARFEYHCPYCDKIQIRDSRNVTIKKAVMGD